MTTSLREYEAELTVSEVLEVADEVVALTLTHPDGDTLPNWTPGAHIDLVLSADITRQYSLCGRPADQKSWRISVLRARDSRGGSSRVHQLDVGSTVRVRGPRNHFPLVGSPSYRFISGGIGITPMLPMIAEADAAGAQWTLLYGGRSRGSMGFLDELAGYGDRVDISPQDERGHLDLSTYLADPTPQTVVYCCGPAPLLDAVEAACSGWPAGALHIERFSAKAPAADAKDDSFEVLLVQSGQTVRVAADKTIFEAVRDCGISVLGSCLEGICGTCETTVLAGEPDHRDSVLTEQERASNETMMICVSRSRSLQLSLDL